MVALKAHQVDAFVAKPAQPVMLLFGPDSGLVRERAQALIRASVEALLAAVAPDCRIVIEAGDLRRNAPLRALIERARNAAALPCYEDDEKTLDRLIDAELRESGLAIAPEARAALLPLLGGDRLASRSEITKLALYARGRERVELDDVMAVTADASALALDALLDAAFAGRTAEVE